MSRLPSAASVVIDALLLMWCVVADVVRVVDGLPCSQFAATILDCGQKGAKIRFDDVASMPDASSVTCPEIYDPAANGLPPAGHLECWVVFEMLRPAPPPWCVHRPTRAPAVATVVFQPSAPAVHCHCCVAALRYSHSLCPES